MHGVHLSDMDVSVCLCLFPWAALQFVTEHHRTGRPFFAQRRSTGGALPAPAPARPAVLGRPRSDGAARCTTGPQHCVIQPRAGENSQPAQTTFSIHAENKLFSWLCCNLSKWSIWWFNILTVKKHEQHDHIFKHFHFFLLLLSSSTILNPKMCCLYISSTIFY